jgi:DGQHR domain-containing protein
MTRSPRTPAAKQDEASSRRNDPQLRYEGFRFRQRPKGPELVVFRAPVHEVLSWARVDELGPKKTGPQRERKEAKVDAIGKFLGADEQNSIPTAIVLAFDEAKAHFELAPGTRGKSGVGHLVIKRADGMVASIVDGQHRLYGMDLFRHDLEVPIVALLDADNVEKAFQFLVINNKSSRVPAAHTKALLAKHKGTRLLERLKVARLAFDAEGIKDVDLVNKDQESPFYDTIDWPTTPKERRMVQATAIQQSLDYLAGLSVPEFDDRDDRRSVFLTIWKTIKAEWPALWHADSRLMSKVGIVCLTRFVADTITSWADSDELDIELTNLEDIESQTKKIVSKMDRRFWSTPWAEKAQGGFDTNQGRERVYAAITQLYRNARRDVDWYTDIDIIDRAAAEGGA